jgi:2,5-diamino-6-(ribosylamino)-4(3H)-pyrimidinone 5'-phosphate reductase
MAKVSVNMAASIDGKIATAARGPVALGSPYDRRRMGEIRAAHDAIIMGAATFEAHPYLLDVKSKKLQKARMKAGKTRQPATIIISSRLRFPKGTPFEKDARAERWIFCGKKAPESRISQLRSEGIHIVQIQKLRPEPEDILGILEKVGYEKILLEGGGELNASFFERDLVDRIYLTFCPILIGGKDAPTIFEGKGFKSQFLRWKIEESRRIGQELYLTFARRDI